ncbi:MAG: TlpA disulfide reductase family protein [Oscillochloridaceae bacterium]|nr:TlpA family protein disulfide reductase [Chloroflexaceae bacterium]MDW8389594.1 TlpA disulfide reductase family protein [Oscillochloridaceae bacterium]
MNRLIVIVLIAATLAACGRQPAATAPAVPPPGGVVIATESRLLDRGHGAPASGDPAPDFSYTLPDGATVRLSDLRGTPVVLNFWATWCLPCVEEMPILQAAYEAAEGDLAVLAVNRNELPAAIARFTATTPVTFPLIANIGGDIGDRYAVTSLPITYFIHRDGTISARHIGALNERALAEQIKAIQ